MIAEFLDELSLQIGQKIHLSLNYSALLYHFFFFFFFGLQALGVSATSHLSGCRCDSSTSWRWQETLNCCCKPDRPDSLKVADYAHCRLPSSTNTTIVTNIDFWYTISSQTIHPQVSLIRLLTSYNQGALGKKIQKTNYKLYLMTFRQLAVWMPTQADTVPR